MQTSSNGPERTKSLVAGMMLSLASPSPCPSSESLLLVIPRKQTDEYVIDANAR